MAGVFLFHTVTGFAPGGSIGVDVFFALSGFVITLLIMKEYRATGRLRVGVFYAKRLARLWPALLALCGVVVIVALVFPASGWGGQAATVVPAAAYVMNLANYGAFGSSTGGNALSPARTLAVEEQFYLVWPLLLLVMLRFWKVRTVAWITAALAAAFLLQRFLLVSGGASLARLYNGPDTRADELLVGCILQGGQNDALNTRPNKIQTATAQTIEVARRFWPGVQVIVLGPSAPQPLAEKLQDANNAVRAGAAAAGAPFIDAYKAGWFTAANSPGFDFDGANPNTAGHAHLAEKFLESWAALIR